MHARFGKWWPWIKAVFALAIVAAIGWRFARDLRSPELWRHSFRPGWLLLCAVCYILGLGCSALIWYRLLQGTGQQPSGLACIRAYFIGLLGKYLPGKAWALFARSAMVRGPGVRLGVAMLTAFYEVLTTMASGVLLSAILFALLLPPSSSAEHWPLLRRIFTTNATGPIEPDRNGLVILSLILFFPLALPLIPPLFNRVVRHLASLRRAVRESGGEGHPPLPHLRLSALLQAMVLAIGSWLLMGLSLWACLQALLPEPLPWDYDAWLRETAFLAVAYVAGFVILIVPSGIGVREFLLTLFLVPEFCGQLGYTEEEARRRATVLAVLLLRVVWTAAEIVVVAIVYWFPGPPLEKMEDLEPAGQNGENSQQSQPAERGASAS